MFRWVNKYINIKILLQLKINYNFIIFRGLDIKYTETIDSNIQHKILNEIEDLRKNDPTLCVDKILINLDNKPKLFAKLLEFNSWSHFGCWLLQIYDNLFKNYNHSVIINSKHNFLKF